MLDVYTSNHGNHYPIETDIRGQLLTYKMCIELNKEQISKKPKT